MQDSMIFDPESGNTIAFTESQLFDILARAQRLAEMEVCNGAEVAARGQYARMWLRLADAANEAHAFAVRYRQSMPAVSGPPPEGSGDLDDQSGYGRV